MKKITLEEVESMSYEELAGRFAKNENGEFALIQDRDELIHLREIVWNLSQKSKDYARKMRILEGIVFDGLLSQ